MNDPFDMPPASAGFDARAGWVVGHLMIDIPPLKLNHAGAIVGNLGGESGLKVVNELHPLIPGSRGGWSWGQWTGDRRRGLEAFCGANGFDVASDEAAYRWLVAELHGGEKHALEQLLKTTSIEAATETFEAYYERPKDLKAGLEKRIAFAKRAITAALGLAHVEDFARDKTPAPPASSVPAPVRRAATPMHLAGGMGIGVALTASATWALTGFQLPVPQDVSTGWVLLFAIPGAILLHKLPWLKSELEGS